MINDKTTPHTTGAVVGIGEALWDLLPEGRKIGGAPANFAYHASQFGLPGVAVSAVGRDADGTAILDTFSRRGLTHRVDRVPYPTGTVQVEIDRDGVPQYNIRENVAWDNIPWTPALEQLARGTRAVCFGTLAQRNVVSRTTIGRFLDAMPQGGDTLVVFDVNLRQDFYTRDILHQSMQRCNLLKINDEELVTVSRLFEIPGIDMERICRTLLCRYSLKALILTCGINGSYVFTPEAMSFLPTPKVKVADTVGAGDSFTAAFTASLLKGLSIEQAHRTAVETSAYVCTCEGAMPRLPHSITGLPEP